MKKDHIDKSVDSIEHAFIKDYELMKGDLEKLLESYRKKSERLDKIIKISDSQQKNLIKLNEELNEYKNHLEEKVEKEINKRKEKERLLFQQSKLAAMGEMMDAVAHQWKQPLSVINSIMNNFQVDIELGEELSKENVNKMYKEVNKQINHLTTTLDEFRTFFRPNKETSTLNIKTIVENTLPLIKNELKKNSIEVTINEKSEFHIEGVENEFKHLVLNIINNSKDAFIENKIDHRKIVITIDGNQGTLEITDNAGGIPKSVIADVFKANVTTKDEGKGTGIGLYMSSQIAEKHNGTLSVENFNGGAKFLFKTSLFTE